MKPQVLILCGGRGTRLRSVTGDLPKPLARVAGKPFLEWLILNLSRQGFREFCFLSGYRAELIRDYFGDGERWGVQCSYSEETSPLGTGGALRKAVLASSHERFLALNGDTYFNMNYAAFTDKSEQACADFSIGLREVDDCSRYGQVIVSSDFRIQAFLEKRPNCGAGFINAGVYSFGRNLSEWIPEGPISLETQVFPELLTERKLCGYVLTGDFIDIGIPEDFYYADQVLANWYAEGLI